MWLVASSRGEALELSNGGRVEGTLVESANATREIAVIALAGGGRLEIPRSQIARVDSTSAAEKEYAELARKSADSVEAHWKLAQWCRDHKLRERAQQHLTRILELEPNHEEARAILGFRKRNGEWMTRDDVMASRGLVIYEGRHVTRQHMELLKRQKAAKQSQADWSNRLEQLRRWLTGRRVDRASQARAEIESLSDPQAAPAVVVMLRRENDADIKRLWMDAASRLNHQLAVDALVELSLADPDPEVRHDSLEYLVKSGRQGLLTPYVRALRDKDNEIVNRAGAALGQIGDPAAMRPLVEALITQHRASVPQANPDQQAYLFSPQGSGYNFGSPPPPRPQAVRNPDVLAALVSLSGGTSFDYDQGQWRRWLAAQAKQPAVDVRRDN
jgi:hypothetical protein